MVGLTAGVGLRRARLSVRIAVGTDEVTTVTEAVERHLTAAGHEVVDIANGKLWPEVGRDVAAAIVDRGRRPGLGVVLDRHRRVDGRQQGGRRARRAVHRRRDGSRSPPLERRQRAGPRHPTHAGRRTPIRPTAIRIVDAFLATEPDESETDNISRLL